MRRSVFKFFVGLIGCLALTSAYAGDIPVAIKLSHISATKVSEGSGDEVYFSVTHYSNQKGNDHQRIPMFPTHWLSQHLSQIKDIPLWQQTLSDGEAVQIILSLIEHDSPPWNVDDHIGSVKVTLKNHDNRLEAVWGQPDFKDKTPVEQSGSNSEPDFILKGNASEYSVNFVIEQG